MGNILHQYVPFISWLTPDSILFWFREKILECALSKINPRHSWGFSMPSIAEAQPYSTHSPKNCRKRGHDDQESLDCPMMFQASSRHIILPSSQIADRVKSAGESFYGSELAIVGSERGNEKNRGMEKRLLLLKAKRNHQSPENHIKRFRFSPASTYPDLTLIPTTVVNQEPRHEGKMMGPDAIVNESKDCLEIGACHICRRKPTDKNELQFYVDCERCQERTCWICIRQCDGIGYHHRDHTTESPLQLVLLPSKTCGVESFSRHDSVICSRCCVEKGAEGEVWCFGCLEAQNYR